MKQPVRTFEGLEIELNTSAIGPGQFLPLSGVMSWTDLKQLSRAQFVARVFFLEIFRVGDPYGFFFSKIWIFSPIFLKKAKNINFLKNVHRYTFRSWFDW